MSNYNRNQFTTLPTCMYVGTAVIANVAEGELAYRVYS